MAKILACDDNGRSSTVGSQCLEIVGGRVRTAYYNQSVHRLRFGSSPAPRGQMQQQIVPFVACGLFNGSCHFHQVAVGHDMRVLWAFEYDERSSSGHQLSRAGVSGEAKFVGLIKHELTSLWAYLRAIIERTRDCADTQVQGFSKLDNVHCAVAKTLDVGAVEYTGGTRVIDPDYTQPPVECQTAKGRVIRKLTEFKVSASSRALSSSELGYG